MRLGCCADIEQANIVHKAGFDFIECTVVSLIPEKSDAEFAPILQKYLDSPVPIEACNILLPSDLKIVGETVDEDRIKRYLDKALFRAKQIGAVTVVFGSGGARSYPEGFSKEKAEAQIIHFLNIAADYAEPLGITIVIEPLNVKESNMINSIPEAMKYSEKINRKSIQVLADFYHMDEENEPLENIVSSGERLKHVHVADTGRMAPGTGSYPYAEFVNCLKKVNYQGRVSIECSWNTFESEVSQSNKYLKSVFKIGGLIK